MDDFLWSLGQSISAAFTGFPVVTMLLLMLLFASVATLKWDRKEFLKWRNLLALSPFLLTITILIVGTVFEQAPANLSRTIIRAVQLLFGAQLFLIAFSMWKLRSLQYFVGALGLLQLWHSVWVVSIAVMSITGTWL
jgi:hypothetical protein